MASTYVNDLRLAEMATGDQSGTWGNTTNTNLELIGEALGYGTEGITTNADTHTTTVADGATDPGRAMYIEYTGTLDSACTITIAPNTLNRMHFIENGTSGSQNIIIKQGSGATITIPPGDVKAVYLDGAGSGAKVVDAFASLNVVDLKVQDDLTVTDDVIIGGDIDLEGAIDVNGTANLDVVDIDGAVDMASTLQVDGVATFTGRDIHSGGITIANAGQIGSVGDTDAIAIASDGVVTLTQKLVGTELDISGNVDVDGTTETDVLTINGSQFNYKAFGTSSIMIGDTTTGTIDAADYNTGVGVDVFAALTSGDGNTAVGFQTLAANTSGGKNSAFGQDALKLNTTGIENAAFGFKCLDANVSGNYNCGFGKSTLGGNTGSNNSAFGAAAMAANSSGASNTAVGYAALDANTTANHNTAVGASSLSANTTGTQNTALGSSAGRSYTTGNYNVAIGYAASDASTTSSDNVSIGRYAMITNTTGGANVGIGSNVMYANTTGNYNTAIGYGSLDANTTASYNIAMGYLSATRNTTGTYNTALGSNALAYNTTSNANTAVGYNAGTLCTGAENTFVGYEAGGNVTTGADNTFIGYQAAHYQNAVTTGADNTVVGAYARTSSASVSNEGVYGRYALGQGAATATIGISGNGVHIALNGSTTSWSAHSDERLKENIQDSTAGLSFINDLRPITYNWKSKKDISEDFVNYYDADSDEPVQGQVKQTNHGFIAQEVKTAIDAHPEIKEGHSIWRESPDGVQNVADGALVPMLVKAVQELSAEVETLKSQL